MIEAKSAVAPPAPDRPQDRDPGEFLPWLPCTLALDLPVVNFTVGHLLSLTKGSIVETAYHQSSDLPLRVNGQLVGWTEFEVVGERLAVRQANFRCALSLLDELGIRTFSGALLDIGVSSRQLEIGRAHV